MKTAQLEQWRGEFGRAYTDRNSLNPTALDALYCKNFGVARSELNQRFLANVPRDARILEVGCNEKDANVDCMFLLSRRRPASAPSGRDVQEA